MKINSDPEDIIVISGTSAGIGKELALLYLNKGNIVYGCSRGEATIRHANYFHVSMDICNEELVRIWARKVKRLGKRIKALICNAGTSSATSLFLSTSSDDYASQVNTNITGTYLLCREFGKLLLHQKEGRIINFSSVLAGLHEEGTSIYSATKKAIEELTKIIAKELAPYNITCNCVAPGMVITPLTKRLGEQAIQNVINKQNIKRAINIDEIASVCDFFIAPESSCITGQIIYLGLVC